MAETEADWAEADWEAEQGEEAANSVVEVESVAHLLVAWEESSAVVGLATAETAGVVAEAEVARGEVDLELGQRAVEDWVVVPLERGEEDSATADLEAEVWVVAEKAGAAETVAAGSAKAPTVEAAGSGACPRECQAESLVVAETEAADSETEEEATAAEWRGWEEEGLGVEAMAADWTAVGVGRVEEEAQALCQVQTVAEACSVEAVGVV